MSSEDQRQSALRQRGLGQQRDHPAPPSFVPTAGAPAPRPGQAGTGGEEERRVQFAEGSALASVATFSTGQPVGGSASSDVATSSGAAGSGSTGGSAPPGVATSSGSTSGASAGSAPPGVATPVTQPSHPSSPDPAGLAGTAQAAVSGGAAQQDDSATTAAVSGRLSPRGLSLIHI